MAPGNSWAGSNKGISDSERANTASDSVRIWSINITSEDDIPTSTSAYPAGSLLVKDITDERGNETISYIDELGRTILTKTQLSGSPTTGHTGWLCTYYVYDEMNHLRMVISPKAIFFLLSNSWNLAGNTDVVDKLCYSYWYDNRGRITEKHIPDKGKTYTAYDLLDRAVMTQDAHLRLTSQWAFIKYDGQSRAMKSGLITLSGVNKDTVINQAARNSDYPTLSGTYTILTETYYDDYSWTSGTPLDGNLKTSNINSTNFITTYNASPDYAQPLTKSSRTRGSVTGGKKLVLGTSTYLYSAIIYDEDGRAIQGKQTNLAGNTDVLTTEYNFANWVLRTHVYNKESALGDAHTLLTKYTYDHIGRLKKIQKNIDSSKDKTISIPTYNELGQLSSKALGTGIASENFTYNIRGWLTGINKDYVENASASPQYFGEALYYDYGFATTILNGNITGAKWKSAGDGIERAYGFTYDKANRLTTADFTQQNQGSSSWTNDKMDFTVSGLKYDPNGNITFMNQRGMNVNAPALIDSLKYTYFTNSNQLQKVKDFITTTPNLGDFQDTSLSADDYVYDENGNQLKDNNKHIHTTAGGNGIFYNFLNKPDSITVNSKGTIAYTYDATGGLLKKTIIDKTQGISTIITYTMGFVYQQRVVTGGINPINDTLQYVLHEEGRIRWSYTQVHPSGKFVYDYFLKDHLNNIRSVVTDEKDTAFYPVASLESGTIANEKTYYTGLDSGVVARSTVSTYPSNDTYTTPNDYVQKLRGDGVKIGAGILLKVMAGDTINVHASSWYRLNGLTPDAPVSPLTDIVSALTNSLPGVSGNKYLASQLGSTVLNPSITSFLNTRDATGNSSHPDSWLNIIVLDEQLNPVITSDGNNSYFAQVGTSAGSSVLQYNPSRPITKNGYVYIYVSNETPNIYTYWDNLQVTHIKGPLLQEEGYYPFGLEMKAVSSQAALKPQSRYKFNAGTELEDNFDVDYYETPARNYDAQIGRFTGIDAMSEQTISLTTYQFGGNNPLNFNDPTGLLLDPDRLTKNFTYGYSDPFGDAIGFSTYVSSGEYMGSGGGGYGGDLVHINGSGPNGSYTSDDLLKLYIAGNGPITPEIVQKYFAATYSGDLNIYQINTYQTEGGYGIDYTLSNEVDANGHLLNFTEFQSQSEIEEHIKDWSNIMSDVTDSKSEKQDHNDVERIVQATQLGIDVNATTWVAMSRIAGAAKALVKLGENSTIVGLLVSSGDAIKNIASGKGQLGDALTLVADAGILASMYLGGEIIAGAFAISVDIYNLAH